MGGSYFFRHDILILNGGVRSLTGRSIVPIFRDSQVNHLVIPVVEALAIENRGAFLTWAAGVSMRHDTGVVFCAAVLIELMVVVWSHLTCLVCHGSVLTLLLIGDIIDDFLAILWQFSLRRPLARNILCFFLALWTQFHIKVHRPWWSSEDSHIATIPLRHSAFYTGALVIGLRKIRLKAVAWLQWPFKWWKLVKQAVWIVLTQ